MYSPEIMEAIVKAIPPAVQHSIEGLPEEVVGLVLSDGSTIPLINQARSDRRFEVSVAQLANVLSLINPDTHLVYSLYHSHPGSSLDLSPADQTNMRIHWSAGGLRLPWLVVSPETSEARLWWIDEQFDALRSFDPPVVIRA